MLIFKVSPLANQTKFYDFNPSAGQNVMLSAISCQQRLVHADGVPVTMKIFTHILNEARRQIAAKPGKPVWGVLGPIQTQNAKWLGGRFLQAGYDPLEFGCGGWI
jgi:hypothetical protein